MRFASRFLFAVMTLATCLPASAQQKAGTFMLPYATRWNHVLVPAGEYSISIYSESQEISMLESVRGKQSALFLVPLSHDYGATCASSTLSMARAGHEWKVQSICFADTGLKLYFTTPPSRGRVLSSATAMSAAGTQ